MIKQFRDRIDFLEEKLSRYERKLKDERMKESSYEQTEYIISEINTLSSALRINKEILRRVDNGKVPSGDRDSNVAADGECVSQVPFFQEESNKC